MRVRATQRRCRARRGADGGRRARRSRTRGARRSRNVAAFGRLSTTQLRPLLLGRARKARCLRRLLDVEPDNAAARSKLLVGLNHHPGPARGHPARSRRVGEARRPARRIPHARGATIGDRGSAIGSRFRVPVALFRCSRASRQNCLHPLSMPARRSRTNSSKLRRAAAIIWTSGHSTTTRSSRSSTKMIDVLVDLTMHSPGGRLGHSSNRRR